MSELKEFPIFPISPTFVSCLTKDTTSACSIGDDLNNNGVFDSDVIEGLLAVIAKDGLVEHPTVLFEFIPKSFVKSVSLRKKEIVKIVDPIIQRFLDDRVLLRTDVYEHVNLKPSCNFFRNQIDEINTTCKGCYYSDSRVGILAKKKIEGKKSQDSISR